MTDDSTAVATAGPPPTADPQDPLPESAWVWRRIFIFIFGGIAIAGVGAVLWMIAQMGSTTLSLIARLGTVRDVRALDSALDVVTETINALRDLGFWLIMVVLADRILYLIAPSAEQAVKMLATVSAWKGGISTSSFARATGTDGSTAEAGKSAGPAATQPVPQTAQPVPPPTATTDWTKYAG